MTTDALPNDPSSNDRLPNDPLAADPFGDPLRHGAQPHLTAEERAHVTNMRQVLLARLTRLELLQLIQELLPVLANTAPESATGTSGVAGMAILHKLVHTEHASLESILLVAATLVRGTIFLYTAQRQRAEEEAHDPPREPDRG